MEAIGSSETSVATQQTTRRHIPEDDTLLQVGFEVLTAVVMKSIIFLDITPCSPLKVN
jgi:hypothetical protein